MKCKYLLIVIAIYFAIITFNADSSLGVQTPELRVVALSGTQAPGLDSLAQFTTSFPANFVFGAPVINASGQTAFESGTTSGSQVFSEGLGSLDLVGPGAFARIQLNAAGQTVYESSDGIFSKKPGEALETIAQRDDPVPNADNGFEFRQFPELGLSDSGRITFGATVGPDGITATEYGIFSHEAGVLNSVVREGDLSPGPVGDFLNPPFRFIHRHSVNASGQIVFAVSFGVFTIGQEGASPVALGASTEVQFSDFRSVARINASGETAFFTLSETDPFEFRRSILSTGSGALQTVAIEGDQAPGVEPGVVFEFDNNSPNVLLNDEGQTSFYAFLAGENVDSSNDGAIFSERAGELELVVRDGDQVPGSEDVFFNLGSNNSILQFNAAGQLAFLSGLNDRVSTTIGRAAIFATDLDGEVIEIVRTGDLIDVNDDPMVEDLREVSFLRFSEDKFNFYTGGRSSSSLNDSGQLAFAAGFTDGSQAVLVSNRAVFEAVQLGDINLNGEVDFTDIGPFIAILSTDEFLDQADINRDGQVNFLDIAPFIKILTDSETVLE